MSFGPPRSGSSLLLALFVSPPVLANDLFADSRSLSRVLTATRLKQSSAAVPGSMTVLDSGQIKASGARDIGELLHLMPDMMVGNLSGNQAVVNYHGATTSEARRMQVLIDGRSGLATVDWSDIPVTMEHIERIEVFRGPNTVSYGANALMAVVNIITRAPVDSHGTRLKITRGQRCISDCYAIQGRGWKGGDLRLSLSGREDDGFDSEAVRSPDMFENNINWSYQVTNLQPTAFGQSSARYFVRTHGPGNLEQEHMRSWQLGYNGCFMELGLSVDVKLSYDEITGMISEPMRNNQYIASNANPSQFSGTETPFDWPMIAADSLRVTDACVDAQASNPLDERLTARNSGSVGWLRDWSRGNSAVFHYTADALSGYRFERVDTRLARRIASDEASLGLAGVLQQRPDNQPTTFVDNRYDDRHGLYFSAELSF